MTQIVGITTTQLVFGTLLKGCLLQLILLGTMQLRFMLQKTKKGCKKMMDHILKIEGIANNLATIGGLLSSGHQFESPQDHWRLSQMLTSGPCRIIRDARKLDRTSMVIKKKKKSG